MIKPYAHFATLLPQSVGAKEGPVAPEIVPSAAYAYANAQEAEAIFRGDLHKPLYARMGNPTNAKLESVLSKMEGAAGAIVTASGMGAISMVLSAFLRRGDHVLCIGGFFGGTYALMRETLERFGIENHFRDVDDWEGMQSILERGVQIVLVESVGNPNMKLPDLPRIASLCSHFDTLLLVDNTATPLQQQPLSIGADIVLYSTTKNISGHSAALGGAALFRAVEPEDKLHTPKYAHLHKIVQKAGAHAMIAICKKRALRDLGMSANAFGSFVTLLGLETLALRMEHISKSTPYIAKKLDEHLAPKIVVRHPSLPAHEHHERYRTLFPMGCGPLLTLECGTKARAFALLNRARLLTQTANIGDNRTLALHMQSTIYRDFTSDERAFLGITEGLIRISVGLEDPDAIVEDILRAAS